MGVQDLWSIVEPVRESVPLYSLSGKTLAVDLSLWVCEAQHVQAMMGRVTKPHLRNLFFRVSSLTLMGVKLVFVMEGEAPKLKAETMSKRTQTRYGGFKKASAPKCNVNTSRGRFNAILRECAEMLDFLGVPWVTAAGEAEAMCAFLDSQGVVDGCITNDGDAFLYGARTVYRNFNMNSKDPQVDCYRTSRVQTELQLSRENLVGLAIFLGCDYIPKGIAGVGKEHAMRLIQMLRGTTLLQRFSQWKEENAAASAAIVKKVPHCQVCRHPGSAKAHERSGCGFCESKHFCQPQDFDYQCPCEWHLNENTRQALSFEANIKKKTLASQHFPFTEIIQEFLTSRDKPVSHFKRRQPNLLLMQKFAYYKMEWPKHYTSEKVLVLMTYMELMNRKCGREMSSQIKPIRILKPRVRNSISCFEVIWSAPEHYVFPDDQPTHDQNEVKTIEEECLVRVAYPELVESFMRDKAQAEENKANKKKSKKKKEKTPDPVSHGLSDLLTQMNLQCSSTAPPSKTPSTISNKDDPVLIILDTPENHKRQQKSDKDHGSLSEGPGTPRSRADSAPSASASSASPSLSSVIEALHLSDIDWDAQSFTSSPQSAANLVSEPQLSKMTDSEVNEAKRLKVKTSSDIREADFKLSAELSYTECPLRDRVLMRNTARAVDQMEVHSKGVLKLLHCELAPQSSDSNSVLSGHLHGKRDIDGNVASHFKDVPTDEGRNATNKMKTKQQFRFKANAPCRTKDMYDGSHKRRQKCASVQTATSSLAVPQQRHHSEPPQSRKTGSQTTKKSVCLNVISSSEDSDSENHFYRQSKTRNRIKDDFPQTTKALTKTAQPDQPRPLKPQSRSADIHTKSTPASAKAMCRPISPAIEIDDVFLCNPPSPVTVLDSDSSVNCGDSPLPLAERLKLKFLQ